MISADILLMGIGAIIIFVFGMIFKSLSRIEVSQSFLKVELAKVIERMDSNMKRTNGIEKRLARLEDEVKADK